MSGPRSPIPDQKARAIGIWTGIAAVGLAVGPTLGGILTEHVGWRSIFAFNPVIGIIAIFLTYRHVTETRDPASRSFDVPGQLLFIVGIGALTYALIQGGHDGWGSALILGCFALAVVVLVTFVLYEMHARDPMMDMHVFRDRVYDASIYAVFATLFCHLRDAVHHHAVLPERARVQPGEDRLPDVGDDDSDDRPLAPERSHRRRTRRAPSDAGGLSTVVIGTGILAASDASQVWVALIGLAFVGAAGGLAVPSATSEAMGSIPPERSGMASGILSSQRALGSTAGFAIMGSILAVVVSTTLPDDLEPIIPNAADRQAVVDQVSEDANPQAVATLIGPGKPLPDNVTEDTEVLDAADDAFVAGIRVAMLVGCLVALSSLIIGWFLFPRRRRGAPDDADIPEVSCPRAERRGALHCLECCGVSASSRRAAMQMLRRIVVIVFRGRDRVCRGGAVDQRTGPATASSRRSSIPPPSVRSTRW